MARYFWSAIAGVALAVMQVSIAAAQDSANVPHVWAITGNSRVAIPAGESLAQPQSGGMNMMKSTISFKTFIMVKGIAAATTLRSRQPSLEVRYDGVPGIDPDSYEAVLVKLSPAAMPYHRLVGEMDQTLSAGGGKAGPMSFSQTRVPTSTDSMGRGHVRLTPQVALDPGQYAIVLRPIGETAGSSDPNAMMAQMAGMSNGPPAPWKSVWDFAIQ